MKVGTRVEILIDDLVLHGFAPSDRDAIAAALSHELGRLIEASGSETLAGLGDTASLRAADVTLQPDARAHLVGSQVARSVHGSLNRPGQGALK